MLGGAGLPSAMDETRRNRLIESARISILIGLKLLKGFKFFNELQPNSKSAGLQIADTISTRAITYTIRSPNQFSAQRADRTVAPF